MSHCFYDLTHFRGQSRNTKIYFIAFWSNENFKICFRDLLTFRELCLALLKAQSIIDYCYGIMQFLHLIDSIQNCLSFNWQYQFRQTDRIVITFPFLILVGIEHTMFFLNHLINIILNPKICFMELEVLFLYFSAF